MNKIKLFSRCAPLFRPASPRSAPPLRPIPPPSPTILLITCCLAAGLLFSCNNIYTPRPKGYFKIDFPSHQYQSFDQPDYPYIFEYPVYARIIRDSSFFEAAPENPYWINIDFPRFNARIYISYKKIGPNNFDKLKDDAYKMTLKHTPKATSIEDSVMQTRNGISGIFFHVGGNAATAKQFYLTDSTKNFLRGALYFDATPNEDSLGIVNRFLQDDMLHLINTFRWKTPSAAPHTATPPALAP